MELFRPVDTQDLKARKKSRAPHLVIALFVGLVYVVGLLDGLEHSLMDLRFLSHDRTATSDSVLIAIDSQSIRDLEKWPWPRRLHADLIRQLTAAGAARIFLDVDLSSTTTEFDDLVLASAIEEARGKVVLPVFKQRTKPKSSALFYTEPLAAFAENAQIASVNIQPEPDSLVRRYNRVEPWKGTLLPALATQLNNQLPDSLSPFYIDYAIRTASIPYISFIDVLNGKIPDDLIKGRTVFVGATAIELGDILPVPVYGALPGSLVQALAYESIKTGRAIERTNPIWCLGIIMLIALLLGPRISAWSWSHGFWITFSLVLVSIGAATLIQISAPISVDISPVLLVLTLSYVWALIHQIDIQSLGLFKQRMAVIHNRALMSSIVGASIDGIVIAKPDGEIQFANTTACELFGRTRENLIGQSIKTYFQSDKPEVESLVPQHEIPESAQVLSKLQPGTIISPGHTNIPVEATTTVVPLELGKSTFEVRTGHRAVYIYTLHDIRGRLKSEKALLEAAEKAISADHAKSELLANVSHELRTPLNAIIGFSTCMDQQMFGPLGNEKYAEYVHDILFSGQHLLELVENILTISRVEAKDYVLNEENIDIARFVGECTNIIKAVADEKNIEMTTDIPDNLPKLFADPRSFRQIILNLLSNALKFTSAGGRVHISAQLNGSGEMELIFTDTGIGIAEGDLERITKPFEQVEGAMARSHGGAGLGLHIVSGLIALHNASIDIKSGLGVGTKVFIIFPRRRVVSKDNVVPLLSTHTED